MCVERERERERERGGGGRDGGGRERVWGDGWENEWEACLTRADAGTLDTYGISKTQHTGHRT